MSCWTRWLQHGATLLVGGTGLVYAVMKYLLTPPDPWAVVNHPLQPLVQHLHVLAAPALVFAAGLLWRDHVLRHWRSGDRQRRRSGAGITLTLLPMIASGYLLQVATAPAWRTAWVVIHVAASLAWLSGYGVHQVVSRRLDSAAALADPACSHGTQRSSETS